MMKVYSDFTTIDENTSPKNFGGYLRLLKTKTYVLISLTVVS
jgi:hypothetical protein